ncbi:MAG: 5-(carboxyamino)imidazole ribonucleotide mutase [Desulfovibrionaceae bacterium]|nr:5-(carboxyamino)imidazole ribonucleotide mutase [Desulfovibrionaceae bacterium]
MAKVAILMGSASDEECVAPCMKVLANLGIDYEVTVTSAHRTPKRTADFVAAQEASGCQVFICAAGMAAHLAGAVASQTLIPVIGIPVASKNLGGLDALLSTVQMPAGFPVATVAIDGAKNAAWLAAQILALHDQELKEKIAKERLKMQESVEAAAESINSKYAKS